jgi:ATP-dependent RNA helicase DeaD
MTKFMDFEITKELKRSLSDMGIYEATDIQAQAIPLILSGVDVIGKSQTGSGKTIAFGLPAIEMLDNLLDKNQVQVLVLCPTRELSLQATEELRKLAKYKQHVKMVTIYGGQSISVQINALKQGAQIVVGTPGRIMDHLRRRTLKLNHLRMIVLDEADEMLSMGFKEDIETILMDVNHDHQTVLFSATMPKAIMDITNQFQQSPVIVEVKKEQQTVDTIEQYYFEVAVSKKEAALCRLLDVYNPNLSLIFANTKHGVDDIVAMLKARGYEVEGLHGDMNQGIRTAVMNRFKCGDTKILVATDVAARGIDVNNIEIVFNYDVPQDIDYYIHRIGRTGRAGKSGVSFTFVASKKNMRDLYTIMNVTNTVIAPLPLPTLTQIRQIKQDKLLSDLKEFINSSDFTQHESMVNALLSNQYGAYEIACGLIGYLTNKDRYVDDQANEIVSESFNSRDRKRPERKNDRPERKGSKPDRKAKAYDDSDKVNIELSVGKNDQVNVGRILAFVAEVGNISGKLVGNISIDKRFTTIGVPSNEAKRLVKALNNSKFDGKQIIASVKK